MKQIFIIAIIATVILVSIAIITLALSSEPNLDVTVTGKTSTGNDGIDIYTIPPQSPMNFLQLNAKIDYMGLLPWEYETFISCSEFNVYIDYLAGPGGNEYQRINITDPFLMTGCPPISHRKWIIDDQRTFTWNFTQYIPDPENFDECIIVPVEPGLYRLTMDFYEMDYLYNFKLE